MKHAVLFLVVLAGVTSASAREIRGVATVGIAGGGGFETNFEGSMGLEYQSPRFEILARIGGGIGDKTQTDGYSYLTSATALYRATENISLGPGISHGCFKGDAYDSCAERARLVGKFRLDSEVLWATVFGSIRDAHDTRGYGISYEHEFGRKQSFVIGFTSFQTRVQGVAGTPGFLRNGMSENFVSAVSWNVSYKFYW